MASAARAFDPLVQGRRAARHLSGTAGRARSAGAPEGTQAPAGPELVIARHSISARGDRTALAPEPAIGPPGTGALLPRRVQRRRLQHRRLQRARLRQRSVQGMAMVAIAALAVLGAGGSTLTAASAEERHIGSVPVADVVATASAGPVGHGRVAPVVVPLGSGGDPGTLTAATRGGPEVSADGSAADGESVVRALDTVQLVGAAAGLPGGLRLAHPVANFRLTSPFGWRNNPTGPGRHIHIGQDYAVPCGAPVRASEAGTVVQSAWAGHSGYRVRISHGHGIDTAYSHNSVLIAKVGEQVEQGQLIALAGTTGNSTGCHVHFEVYRGGKWTNPAAYVPRVPGQPIPLTPEELERIRTADNPPRGADPTQGASDRPVVPAGSARPDPESTPPARSPDPTPPAPKPGTPSGTPSPSAPASPDPTPTTPGTPAPSKPAPSTPAPSTPPASSAPPKTPVPTTPPSTPAPSDPAPAETASGSPSPSRSTTRSPAATESAPAAKRTPATDAAPSSAPVERTFSTVVDAAESLTGLAP
ncbi:hypothetical protein GCM10022377_02750 [Zhihengliuella alba]|uniref:M23ase beta-sheet core domain-containing protein n=1 Tax=Zhihengliuella alba TaxID=547018 RepID=A0ABP7CRE2_9MICC